MFGSMLLGEGGGLPTWTNYDGCDPKVITKNMDVWMEWQ